MPSFGNIDDMTLRRLGRTRKSSAIVLDNENQLQERNASKVSGNIITIYSLVLLIKFTWHVRQSANIN